jgi:hypothetical protein
VNSLFVLLWSTAAEASPPAAETGATIQPQVVIDLSSEHPDENQFETWSRLRAWTRVPTQTGVWRMEARGLQRVQSGGSEFHPERLESMWSLELGETSWEGSVGPVWLAVGSRVERWGQLDMLSVVDILNGKDLRAGPLTPPELLRIPTPMLHLQLPLWNANSSYGSLEMSLLPVGASDRVSLVGSDWALLKPGMLESLVEDMEQWEGDPLTEDFLQQGIQSLGGLLSQVSPQAEGELGSLLAAQSSSGRPGSDTDLALKLAAALGRHDVALMAAWMRNRQPNPQLDPVLASFIREERLPGLAEQDAILDALSSGVSIDRPRTWMLGAEFSSWLGPIGLRAETSWIQQKTFATPWMGTVERPELGAAVGLDWVNGSTLALFAEGSWRTILNPPDDLWLNKADHIQAGFGGQLSMWSDRVKIQPGVLWDVSFREWMLRPALSWRPSDSLQMDLALLVVTAPEDAPRELPDAMTTSLGPLGYASDTDSLIIGLTWIP